MRACAPGSAQSASRKVPSAPARRRSARAVAVSAGSAPGACGSTQQRARRDDVAAVGLGQRAAIERERERAADALVGERPFRRVEAQYREPAGRRRQVGRGCQRHIVEREIGLAGADRGLERRGVGQPLDRDARSCAGRAAEVESRHSGNPPQVDQRGRALDDAVAARRRSRKESWDLPVRGAALDRARDRHRQARQERGIRALERERDLPAVGAHAAQVRALAGRERFCAHDVVEERRSGRSRRRIEQPLEGRAARPATSGGVPSAKRRPASNWMRNVRLPRDTIGRSRARPGTITVPGRPAASA